MGHKPLLLITPSRHRTRATTAAPARHAFQIAYDPFTGNHSGERASLVIYERYTAVLKTWNELPPALFAEGQATAFKTCIKHRMYNV